MKKYLFMMMSAMLITLVEYSARIAIALIFCCLGISKMGQRTVPWPNVSRLSMIRIIGKLYLLMFIVTIVSISCTSCVNENSWQFRVKNQTEDTLLIITESIIPDFGVQVNNFDYLDSEPRPEVYNIRYINVSDTIFVLPPFTDFGAWKAWSSHDVLSDNPEADGVTPGWKFIKRMELGGQLLSPEIWNSEQKWRITWEYEDVDKAYSLTIGDAHLK